MLVASEDATSGSVMRTPSGSAVEQRLEPALALLREPKRSSTSMLPVSGALQLNTTGVISERPMRSASGA